MIISLLLFTLAYTWLLFETDYLRIRLPMGKNTSWSDTYNLRLEASAEKLAKRQSQSCPICLKYYSVEVKTITVKSGNSTCHITGCQDCRDKMSADIIKSQTGKHREPTLKVTQIPLFIEQVRDGSHTEPWEYGGKKHNRIVTDYRNVYHDCLVPKEWLQTHEHDLDGYEPTIDVSIDSKALHLNGNYKKGLIQGFMADFTEKKRAGRKVMTVCKGNEVVNCGGDVYIEMTPEQLERELASV